MTERPNCRLIAPATEDAVLLERWAGHFWQSLNVELWGVAMRLAVVVLSAILIFATSALPAGAAEFGTREEALTMVRRVQEKFKKDGPEATFRAINNRAPGFADRDLYPFVTELTGLCVSRAFFD